MIEPDTKDWTWVIDRVCPQCSFDARTIRASDVPDLVRANAASWQRLCAGGGIVTGRTSDSKWSSLEYACHVRDIFRRYLIRVDAMAREDDPLFAKWDQGASAIEDRCDEPTGQRSDGASFTIDTVCRYMIHDPVHHLFDVATLRAPS